MNNAHRHIPVKGAFNIRDLGGYTTAAGSPIPWRRFLRADSLHRIPAHEVQHLHDEGLRLVIDLRTNKEVEGDPSPFATFSDVRFLNIPLFDDLSPQALSQTPAEGDHPLLAFYMSAILSRGQTISTILTEIAQNEKGAVLFNCTAGKDRTGIIAALLLAIAGVPNDQIILDYTLTADYIPDLVAEFLALSAERGGDTVRYARLLESPAPTITATLSYIEQTYGTADQYALNSGLSPETLTLLKTRLTTP